MGLTVSCFGWGGGSFSSACAVQQAGIREWSARSFQSFQTVTLAARHNIAVTAPK